MRKRLRSSLLDVVSPEDLRYVYNSFDVVGNIAIARLVKANGFLGNAERIGATLMATHRNLKTVFIQVGPVAGGFRLRTLALAAGENVTETVHKENGCFFAVDVEKCYFSPRLSLERSRIAGLVRPAETIINMFSGVGCFSIAIAKREKTVKIFSIDINPVAVSFMKRNVRLNRVYRQVLPVLGDSKVVVEGRLKGLADRVLMPLPEKASEYLNSAVSGLKTSGGWIHYYDFEHAAGKEDPTRKVKLRVTQKLMLLGATFEIPFSRVVRPTGPNWYQVALDIHVIHVSDKFY